MNKKYIRLVYFALLAALLFPIITFWLADSFQINVINGLLMIFVLAIFVGLFSARYLVSWLIIILTTVAVAFLLLGYVVMASTEKTFLIIAFPVEAILLSVVRHHILDWSIVFGRESDAKRLIGHYDLNVKLQTYYNASKLYEDYLRKMKRYPEHHQQVEEHHPQYHAKLLREIAKILKETRLRCEFIYYTGDGKFLILSPRVTDEMYKELDEQAYIALQKLDTGIPLMLKVATQRVNLQNCEKFSDLDKLFKHLERGLETDIIVEYLKADQND
jgi:hypothetical protein